MIWNERQNDVFERKTKNDDDDEFSPTNEKICFLLEYLSLITWKSERHLENLKKKKKNESIGYNGSSFVIVRCIFGIRSLVDRKISICNEKKTWRRWKFPNEKTTFFHRKFVRKEIFFSWRRGSIEDFHWSNRIDDVKRVKRQSGKRFWSKIHRINQKKKPKCRSFLWTLRKMFSFKLPLFNVFLLTFFLKISAIRIGKLSQYIYVPSSSNGVVSLSFSTDCTECLCHAKTSSIGSIVLINCLISSRTCFFYSNFTNVYSFERNPNSSIYLFDLPSTRPQTNFPLFEILNPTSTSFPYYDFYSFNWTAKSNRSTLSFVSRHDPAGWLLDDVIVKRTSTSLIVNGGFETGDFTGWTRSYSCSSYRGSVDSYYAANSGRYYYSSTCVNGNETISQQFSTTIGVFYQISFWLSNSQCCSPVQSFSLFIF